MAININTFTTLIVHKIAFGHNSPKPWKEEKLVTVAIAIPSANLHLVSRCACWIKTSARLPVAQAPSLCEQRQPCQDGGIKVPSLRQLRWVIVLNADLPTTTPIF